MYWERTALNGTIVRNCSEVDPELGGRKNVLIRFVEKKCYFMIDTQKKIQFPRSDF